MKTESTVKFVLRLALTLLAITAVVAVALAGVNMITEPAIEALNAQKTQEAIELVLPGGGEAIEFPETDLVSKVYASDAGYAVASSKPGSTNGKKPGRRRTLISRRNTSESMVFMK